MTLPLNIFLNYLFSSKHDLNDELDITILINQRISGCATDANLSALNLMLAATYIATTTT